MSTQLEAIVLKSFDYQDHHKIAKMISPSHGLISVFMSYANKKKSRYRALAEPLTCVTLNLKVPTNEAGGLYYLVHGEILDSFYELKMDFEKIMLFYEMAEIVIKGDVDAIHLGYAYRLMKEVLEIDSSDEVSFRFGVVIFKAKMMMPAGLLPAIDGCVGCSGTRRIVTASVSEGGLVCESCYLGDGIWLSTEMISLWRGIFKLPTERLLKLDLCGSQVKALEDWMKAYYEGYSNIRFASRL